MIELLSNRVQVHFREPGETAMQTKRVVCWVDSEGHVDTRSFEDAEWLIENEIAEWRAVGPEDSEPFLTTPYMDALTDQLRALRSGWREVER